jgi:hypothetical protein
MRQSLLMRQSTSKLVRFLAHSRQYARSLLKTYSVSQDNPKFAPYLPSGLFFNQPCLGRYCVFLGFPALINLLYAHKYQKLSSTFCHSKSI